MRDKEQKGKDRGWNPDARTGEESVTTEERSQDIGESGQFAPGYYNQQTLNKPERRWMDDDIVPPGRH